jgi:hypothetical protein
MVVPTMCFQNFVANYTAQKIRKKDHVGYLEVWPAIGDAKPSNIMVLFPLPLL